MASNITNELQNHVNYIRDELNKLYAANYTDEEREQMESDGEAYDLYSYFADALDIEYTIDNNLNFLGARIAVTLGGPNIYVNTRTGYVEGYWGTDKAEAWISSEVCDEINNVFEDCYNSMRA